MHIRSAPPPPPRDAHGQRLSGAGGAVAPRFLLSQPAIPVSTLAAACAPTGVIERGGRVHRPPGRRLLRHWSGRTGIESRAHREHGRRDDPHTCPQFGVDQRHRGPAGAGRSLRALRAAFFACPRCDGNAHAQVTARLRFPPAAEARKVACSCGIGARFAADIAFGGSRLPLRYH